MSYADDTPDAQPPGLGLHYRAVIGVAGRRHELKIFVPQRSGGGRPQRDAVAHASTLAVAEPLLMQLERWLGASIDPQPTLALPEQHTDDCPEARTLKLQTDVHCELAPAGTEVTLPLALLTGVAKPPEALRTAAVRWPRYDCAVVLETLAAGAIAAAQVAVGSLLLLPGSFASTPQGWPVRLLPQDLSDELAAGWLVTQRNLRIAANATKQPKVDGDEWRVVADAQTTVAADICLFGVTARPVDVPFESPAAALLLCGQRPVAAGRLVAAGQGHGLFIERLLQDFAINADQGAACGDEPDSAAPCARHPTEPQPLTAQTLFSNSAAIAPMAG
jgi:hypothetical protein